MNHSDCRFIERKPSNILKLNECLIAVAVTRWVIACLRSFDRFFGRENSPQGACSCYYSHGKASLCHVLACNDWRLRESLFWVHERFLGCFVCVCAEDDIAQIWKPCQFWILPSCTCSRCCGSKITSICKWQEEDDHGISISACASEKSGVSVKCSPMVPAAWHNVSPVFPRQLVRLLICA